MWKMGLADAVNVFHFAKTTTSPWTLAELASVTDKFAGAYNFGTTEGPLEVLSSLCGLTGIEAIDTTVEGAPSVATIWSLAGGKTSLLPCPPGVAVGVTLQTQRRGKSYRGRTYVMGVPEGHINESGQFVGGELAAWQLRWENWLDHINSSSNINGSLQIASYYHDKVARAQAECTPVIACRVNGTVQTQRRRQAF